MKEALKPHKPSPVPRQKQTLDLDPLPSSDVRFLTCENPAEMAAENKLAKEASADTSPAPPGSAV